jgi:hypothetical protein
MSLTRKNLSLLLFSFSFSVSYSLFYFSFCVFFWGAPDFHKVTEQRWGKKRESEREHSLLPTKTFLSPIIRYGNSYYDSLCKYKGNCEEKTDVTIFSFLTYVSASDLDKNNHIYSNIIWRVCATIKCQSMIKIIQSFSNKHHRKKNIIESANQCENICTSMT